MEEIKVEWIQKKMKEFNLSIPDIVKDTGLDRSNVSAWINGSRPISKNVQLLFYYYLKGKEYELQHGTILGFIK